MTFRAGQFQTRASRSSCYTRYFPNCGIQCLPLFYLYQKEESDPKPLVVTHALSNQLLESISQSSFQHKLNRECNSRVQVGSLLPLPNRPGLTANRIPLSPQINGPRMGTYLFQLVFSNKTVFQMLSFNPGQYSLLSIVLQGKVNMHRIRDKLSLPKFTKRVTGQIDLFRDILLVVSFNLKELVISCFIENLTFLIFYLNKHKL